MTRIQKCLVTLLTTTVRTLTLKQCWKHCFKFGISSALLIHARWFLVSMNAECITALEFQHVDSECCLWLSVAYKSGKSLCSWKAVSGRVWPSPNVLQPFHQHIISHHDSRFSWSPKRNFSGVNIWMKFATTVAMCAWLFTILGLWGPKRLPSLVTRCASSA